MYEYTDKIIRALNKRFIRKFAGMKSITAFDELNILGASSRLYLELEEIVEREFLRLAKKIYKDYCIFEISAIDAAWVAEVLSRYNPVTKYVYLHEVERKSARLAESLIASSTKNQEIDTALRYWSGMVSWYAIEITDEALKKAYKDGGVERVIWISVQDKRRCKECKKREGRIYDIAKVPPKPHIGCRCFLMPYFGEGD